MNHKAIKENMQHRVTVCGSSEGNSEALNALSDFSRRAGLADYLSELDSNIFSLIRSLSARLPYWEE